MNMVETKKKKKTTAYPNAVFPLFFHHEGQIRSIKALAKVHTVFKSEGTDNIFSHLQKRYQIKDIRLLVIMLPQSIYISHSKQERNSHAPQTYSVSGSCS